MKRISEFLSEAMASLKWQSSSAVPWIQQTSAGECGAACLAMVATALGRPTGLAELVQATELGRQGLRFQELKQAAENLGFKARVVRLHDLDDLRHLDRPVILHWQFVHFVVLESFDGHQAQIVDPASGRQWLDRATLGNAYTGLLMWMEASAERVAHGTAPQDFALWPFLRRYLQQGQAWQGLLLASLLMQFLALVPSILSAWIFGSLLPDREVGLIAALAIAALFCGVLQPLLEAVRNLSLIQLRQSLSAHMVGDMMQHLLGARWAALCRRSYGELLTRLHANDEIRALLSASGVALLLDATFLLVGFGFLLLVSPWVAVFCGGLALVAAWVIARLNVIRQRALATLFSRQSEAQGFLVQILMGLETVRASGIDGSVNARFARLFGHELREAASLARIEAKISVAALMLNYSAGLLLLGLVVALCLQQVLGLTQAMLAFSTGLAVLGSAGKLCLGLQHIESVRFQAQLVQEVLDLPQQPSTGLVPTLPARGQLEVRSLSFRHAGNAPWAVQDLHFNVPAGALVAVVGASGSGKSTLLSLLAGMHQPAQGEVLLDASPLSDLSPEWLRRQVLLVPQFPFFFAESVAANLRMVKPGATLAELRAVCIEAGIASEIEALPMAYDTPMGEGGTGLSGGQRQRLALARAMLAQPAILLLDESTSSLDARSEQLVLDRLASVQATRIIAAHRLSTIRSADWIIVLEHGRLVEQGSFSQLSQQAGPFRRLFARQLAGLDSETKLCAS